MSDDRDFNDSVTSDVKWVETPQDPAREVFANTNFTNTAGTASTLYNTGTYNWTPSYTTCNTWTNNYRVLSLKLKPSKELSVTEYYEEIYKLMSLLKDTNWNITSTKVKS
jgi:hypothetical protein